MNGPMLALDMGRRPQKSRPVSIFGRNLRRLRERARMGQEELADRAGIGRATVTRLEVGTVAGPSPKTAEALAGALGVKTCELWQTELVLPQIDAAIEAFRNSHYAAILKPPLDERDFAHLRSLAGSIWLNARPTDEALYHLVLAHRAGPRDSG